MCVCVNQGACKDGKKKNKKTTLSKSMRDDVMLKETRKSEQKSEQPSDQTWDQSEPKPKRSRRRSDRSDQQSEQYDQSVKEPDHCDDRRFKSRNEHKQRQQQRDDVDNDNIEPSESQSLPAQLPTIMLNGDVLSPRPRDSRRPTAADTQSADDESHETTSAHGLPRTRSTSLTPLGPLPPLDTGTTRVHTGVPKFEK